MTIYKLLSKEEVARWRDLGLLRAEDIIDNSWLDMSEIRFVARINFAWYHANQKVKHVSQTNADTYWCRVYDDVMAMSFDDMLNLAVECDYDVLGRRNKDLLTNYYEKKARIMSNGKI